MKSDSRIDNHTFSTQDLQVLYTGELWTEALACRIHGYCKVGAQPQAPGEFYPMMFMPMYSLLRPNVSACFTSYDPSSLRQPSYFPGHVLESYLR
jgi:hypothetical protein